MEDLKRKSLSDITNRFNLKSIEDLRKLVASTSRKPSSLSKTGNLIPKANSISTEQGLCSEVSNASVGSSDVGKSRYPAAGARFQAPPGNAESKGPACITKYSIEKAREGKGSCLLLVDPQPSDTRKYKGKVTTAPLGSSPVGQITVNEVEIFSAHSSDVIAKRIVNPLSGFEGTAISSPSSDKGKSVDSSGYKAIRVARKCSSNLYSCSSGKVNDSKNEVPKPCSLPTSEMEDTGTKSSSSSSSHQNTMGILQPSNRAEAKILESTSDALIVNAPSTRRKTEKRKKNDSIGSFSCPPAMNKSKSKDQHKSGDQPSKFRTAPPIAKKKRFSSVAPQDVFKNEIAFFTELDAEELVIEEVSSDELD